MAAVTTLLRIIWHFVLVADTWQYMDQSGREFLLAFPSKSGTLQDGQITLYVRGPQSAVVTVSVPGQTPQPHTLGSSMKEISISSSALYSSLAVPENRGVLVECPSDITVYVIRGYEEGFLATPKTLWSTEFVVISYAPQPEGHSYFVIAAYESDTLVEIIFRKTGTGNCAFLPGPGVPLTITLQKQEVWGIHCEKQDLTGTFIRSNKPISVISGALVPWKSGGTTLIEFIEEMLIPVEFHGSRFVLPTIAGTSVVLRVVASVSNTTVYADGEIYTYLEAGDYYDIRTEHTNIMCMNSTNPIQIVLLGKDAAVSPSSADGVLGDAYMTTIPPVESFKTSYEIELFYSPYGIAFRTYVILLLESIYADDIDDNLPWTNDSFYEYSDCCNYAAVYLVDSTESKFLISRNYSFGVIQIGTIQGGGWGFIEGIALDPPSCPLTQGYTYLEMSNTCIKQHTTEVTWNDAQSRCENVRSRLVQLDNDLKINTVKTHIEPALANNSFWIGLKQRPDGNFRWTDWKLMGPTDWVVSEPDPTGSCVYLGTDGGKTGWLARTCNTDRGYICQTVLADRTNISLFAESCRAMHPACPISSGYVYLRTSEICIRSADAPMSWTDANADCRASGDHLVTVDTDIKRLQIQTLYRHIWSEYHIGASWHNVTNATFVWTDCSPLVYSNWELEEPVDDSMSCAAANTDGSWYSTFCNVTLLFVCQKPLTTNESVLQVTGPNDGTCAEEPAAAATSSYSDLVTSSFDDLSTFVTTSSAASFDDLSTFVTTSSAASFDDLSTFVTTSSATSFSDLSIFTTSSMTSMTSVDGSLDVTDATSSTADVPTTLFETSSVSSSLTSSASTETTDLASEYQTAYGTTNDHLVLSTLNKDQLTHSALSSAAYGANTIDTTLSQQTTPSSVSSIITSVQQVTDPNPNTTPDRTVTQVCRCFCVPNDRLEDLSPSAVRKMDEGIKRDLLLNTKNLTKTIAKYNSAKDDRPSASGIGAMGVLLIVFTAVVIFGSDIVTFMHSRPKRKISNRA